MATILPKREGENGAQRISNKNSIRGCWVAQSFKGLILGSGLGRDPRVLGWSPNSGFALSVESTWDSLPLPLTPTMLSHSLSQINKSLKKKKSIRLPNINTEDVNIIKHCLKTSRIKYFHLMNGDDYQFKNEGRMRHL